MAKPKMKRLNTGFILIAILGAFLVHSFWSTAHEFTQIPYSEFQGLLRDKKIAELTITEQFIQGTTKEPMAAGKTKFITVRVSPELVKQLADAGVPFSQQVESTFLNELLSYILPAVIFFGLWMFVMRRMGKGMGGMGGQFMSIGKSKAKVYVEDDTRVTFKDVAGIDEVEAELREIVEFLRNPADWSRLGGRMPKGALLVGAPGTGKTLLAKAVAGEAKVPFFSISGSEFVEMFVGVGAARVRDLFEQARLKAPCIIFIDELDALGKARHIGGFSGGNDEKEQTLNQLLVELDGFDSKTGIIILAATNRPEVLDSALLRAGRFDRQIVVDRPDKKGRAAILAVHAKKIKMAEDVNLEQIAGITVGFTGADLANLINEAALVATRRKADLVVISDFTAAVERIVAGVDRKSRVMNPEERRWVAYHEMGHAFVSACFPESGFVHKVSIIPRSVGALGYNLNRPVEDRYITTAQDLKDRMAMLLGGRAAELAVFGHLSTGASDDIAKATDIARSMIGKYGMDPTLGSVAFDSGPRSYLGDAGFSPGKTISEETSRRIDASTTALVKEAQDTARMILEANRSLLDEAAKTLLARESLEDGELTELLARVVNPTAPQKASAVLLG